MQNIFSNHNGMKLESSNRRKFRKFTNICILNDKFLNSQWMKAIINEIREYFATNENKTTTYQNLWNVVKRVH